MRVLVLSKRQYMAKDLLDDRFGRFRELPLELARLGHEVTGICLSYRPRTEGSVTDSDFDAGATVLWHSLNLGPWLAPGAVRYLGEVKRVLTQFRPDIVWACSDSFQVVLGVWLAHSCRIKCVVDLYDNFEAFKATRFTGILPFFKRAVRNADGITCFSRRLMERIQEHYQPKAPLAVIESGVRTAVFRPREKAGCRKSLGLPENAQIIGTAGALYRNRGIDALFRGFELLAASDSSVHLAIAGARERGLRIPHGPRVHDFGILPWDQVPLLFNALDVAVSCYADSEIGCYSFPQKAYEIMACQTPIVSAAVGTMADLLSSHPECLFEPNNPASLAEAVRSQLTMPTQIGHKIPSWSDTAKELEGFFVETVARSVA